jgi:hypothetical protein
MRDFESSRYRGHALPILDQRGDECTSQTCASEGKSVDNAVQDHEGSRPTWSAKGVPDWHTLNALMAHLRQLCKKLFLVVHILVDGTGHIIDDFNDDIFSHNVTSSSLAGRKSATS